MAVKLVSEYRGFLKFIDRSNIELFKWFGSHCDDDPDRIAFMASREWDGMGDLERKPFIKSTSTGSVGVNSYFRYLLHSRYSSGDSTFDPKSSKRHGQIWNSMTQEEKKKFSTFDHTDSGIKHVIEKRDYLHQVYDPKKLSILEFILKTKPRWPLSSRLWFYRNECHSIASSEAKQKWLALNDEDRGTYERCAILDRKRYDFEKKAWITKMLTVDFEANQFTISDFHIPEAKSRIDSLGSFIEMSRDLPALVALKRPRNAFSLFIEAYRYKIKNDHPEFQFGHHLKECSEAWSKLNFNERNFYLEESIKLKESRRKLLLKESLIQDRLTLPMDLFNTTKSIHGPCRPSHLLNRVPSPMSLWVHENNKPKTNVKKQWNSLSEEEKKPFIDRHQGLKKLSYKEKLNIEQKHKFIKQLIKESNKLADLKQRLKLIGSSSKPVKNLYA